MFNTECPICFDNLCFDNLNDKKPIILRCKHRICVECFKEWNKLKNTCPICRESIRRVFKIIFVVKKKRKTNKHIGFIDIKHSIGIKYHNKEFVFPYNELKNMKIFRNVLILNFVKNNKKIQFKLHYQRYVINHIYNMIYAICSK